MPDILIIGAGAIGAFYGGKLAQAGANVTTLSDTKTFHIESPAGNFEFTPVPYSESTTFDYVIVSTKHLPSINWKLLIEPHLSENSAIVLLQNGIDIEPHIQTLFPHHLLISALAFVCVSRVTPSQIVHQDYGRLIIGDYPSGIHPKTKALAELFESANLNCKATESVKQARWRKLVWNAAFNPLSVLCGAASTSDILNHPHTSWLVREIMTEVVALAKADGIILPDDCIDKNISDTATMTPYKTSMLLDFENRRPMEVEAILGNAVRIAQKDNLSTPYLSSIYSMLTLLNEKNTAQ